MHMLRYLALELCVLLTSPAMNATDPAPVSPVRFPVGPIVPAPMPTPSNVITQLNTGEWYLVPADVEMVWKTVPTGVVQVVAKPTPFAVAGKFAGGTGLPDEERAYKDAFLYQVKPVGSGIVTLIGTPKGKPVAGESDFIVQTLTVGSPAPAPPSPIPTPVDPLAVAAQAAFAAEPASVSKATDKVVFATVLKSCGDTANWLNVSTVGDLFTLIHSETRSRLGTRLDALRKLVGSELGKVLPSEDKTVVLTAQQKADAAAQLKRLSVVVDALK